MQTKVSVKVPGNRPKSLIMCKRCLVFDTWLYADNHKIMCRTCLVCDTWQWVDNLNNVYVLYII